MLRTRITAAGRWRRWRGRPLVIGVFSFRYDEPLVRDLQANLDPFVDGWVSWDDRERTELWYHEGEVRNHLTRAAAELGADWILAADPDERYERAAADIVRSMTREKTRTIFGFSYRELYSPEAYRVDGVWSEKVRWNLFPVFPGQSFYDYHVHSPWYPREPDYTMRLLDANLYHLKMIHPDNRIARRDLYVRLDPHRDIQPRGYEYLTDEVGARFERIPTGRDYHPPYGRDYRIRQFGSADRGEA